MAEGRPLYCTLILQAIVDCKYILRMYVLAVLELFMILGYTEIVAFALVVDKIQYKF